VAQVKVTVRTPFSQVLLLRVAELVSKIMSAILAVLVVVELTLLTELVEQGQQTKASPVEQD
jgi:hypothetical protein